MSQTLTAPAVLAQATTADATSRYAKYLGFDSILIVVTMLLLLLVIPRTMADPDIWWHLRNAQETLLQRTFVTHDAYSFTLRGVPWIDHEWLSEIPFYLAWRAFGLNGVYGVTVALIESIFLAVLWLAWRLSHSVIVACAVTFGGALLATVSFGPRTLLFGWLCLAVQLVLLQRFQSRPRAVLLLPPPYLLWINLHGSWMIGLALLAMYSAAGFVRFQRKWIDQQPFTRQQSSRLAAAWAGIVPALFCNPWGWRLVAYPFNFAFRQTLNVANVQEWQSLDLHSLRGRIVLLALLLLVGRQLLKPRKWSLQELAWLAVALYSAFNYSRFLFLLALLGPPVLARSFARSSLVIHARSRPATNAILSVTLLILTCISLHRQSHSGDSAIAQYPSGVLPTLAQLPPQKRMLNEFMWGGYLEWYARQTPTFIDSRTDIFEYNGVLSDYLHIVHLENSLALLDQYNIDYVLFKRDTPLIYLLTRTHEWHILYQDAVSTLMERTLPLTR